MSLDHIIPVTLGGSTTVENLQWVHKQANQMKWNYREAEFLELIRQIAVYRLGMN